MSTETFLWIAGFFLTVGVVISALSVINIVAWLAETAIEFGLRAATLYPAFLDFLFERQKAKRAARASGNAEGSGE